eukprot:tig00020563_g11380.t1
MGFEDQIHDIVARIAKERQTLLFSATMPEEIEALAEAFLKNPIRISIGTILVFLETNIKCEELCVALLQARPAAPPPHAPPPRRR